ncbi:hypothetical protein LG047_10970 [Methylocystis sp. WRRC1]|uniref:hypothetical protein n=1 Tax=Methylocystis sp. WRRC1 TaxID=1732014 RepID=UPI001D155F1D|nr:hypothetical protein [Methylocystis sp. WRRC1]MCC3245845.1 hypothetical protein [Methylocystis sp. WRRC1]
MRLAESYASASAEEIGKALAGGRLVLYSTGRPPTADHAVTRSAALAEYVFASPAFDAAGAPQFGENPVAVKSVGTPGWARAFAADGAVVADFSVGPGATEIKLDGISATPGFPLKVESLKIALPAENVTWEKTAFGHVYVTSSEDRYRKLSVRG